MDEDEPLLLLDPGFLIVLRIKLAIFVLALFALAAVSEALLPGLPGAMLIPVLLLGGWLVLALPVRRFRRWGYHLGPDQLRIVHGHLFYSDTVVPLGRVQHIDVHQGPLARRYGLAMLTLHTAGNHNSSVSLPGLKHADALVMRETIRLHIKAAQH